MADVTIRLNRTVAFSENHGECGPDDPLYRVRYWQGGTIKNAKGKTVMVNLPFDCDDELVPDDGRTAPWLGKDADGKPVEHRPLWTDDMRALLQKKIKRVALATQGPEIEEEPEVEDEASIVSEVNFVSWLTGKARYEPRLLRAAAKIKYSKNYPQLKELVADLVLDEKLVPESQLSPEIAKLLPPAFNPATA